VCWIGVEKSPSHQLPQGEKRCRERLSSWIDQKESMPGLPSIPADAAIAVSPGRFHPPVIQRPLDW
jgi:hypothetical protein